MPTYEYRCLDCKRQFEVRQSFDDKPVADCPTCHGVVRRLFCAVPVIFNGPGFYVTDCREEERKGAQFEGLKSKAKDTGGDGS